MILYLVFSLCNSIWGLFYLIIDGGWVWVILGLCWVCEGVPERRGKEIIKNVKRMNILLNKCVE